MLNAKKFYYVLGALLLILAIGIWGAQPTAASPALQEETEQQDESEQSVWDVIMANEQLSEFETLVRAAVLADNLDQDGPFTVFAPTNAALESLQSTFGEAEATPTEILLYHIVNGRYNGPNVAGRSNLTTLMGEQINVRVEDGQIVLNDMVTITTTDIVAENGVVHIIDQVLLPPQNALRTSDESATGASLWQVLEEDGRFTTFLTLAQQAGLADELSNPNTSFTVFAPTDTAFDNLSEAQTNDYTKNDKTVEAVLSYHVVGDRLGINQIATDEYIPTLEGRPLFVTYDEDNPVVMINGQPLSEFNIVAANGVIHVVDTVLAP